MDFVKELESCTGQKLECVDIGGGLCDDQTMIAEREFLQQLGLVNRIELAEDGQLVMYNFDEPLLWAVRLPG